MTKGKSPLIFAGPHNGHLVPEYLYDEDRPLGLHPSSCDINSPFRRHEACDWGVAELFEKLQELERGQALKHNYIAGNYSRLVCDLNRLEKNAITKKTSEDRSIVPSNIKLNKKQTTQRIAQIHTPYHQALKTLIENTQKEFGYVIFLDIHSFTRIWNGKERNARVGTLAFPGNTIEMYILKNFLALFAEHNFNLTADEPYTLKKIKNESMAATARALEKYGIWYTGLEIRNDLLSTPELVTEMAALLHEVAAELVNPDHKTVFTKEKNDDPTS